MALRDLAVGMRGLDVRAAQEGLNEYFRGKRPPLKPDGVFGPKMKAAVEAFQLANPGTGKKDGTPDGTVGRRTRRKLFPLAVVTVSTFGYRLTMPTAPLRGIQPPNLGPGPLQPPGTPQPGLTPNPNANVLNVDWSEWTHPAKIDFTPQHFPGLRLPMVTPGMPLVPRLRFDPNPAPAPAPSPSGPPFPFAQIHHMELLPGSQTIMTKPGQTSFTLAMQGVAMRGDDDGAHQEFAMGSQIGTPNADGSGSYSFLWYAQITDVDRFGALGLFHWWQPYAQVGVQNTTGSFRPVFTGNLFPINLGFDINKALSVNIAGGVALTYDPVTGIVTAGIQGTTGLVLKFDMPVGPK